MAAAVYVLDEYYYASLLQRSVRSVYVLTWIAYQYSRNTAAYDTIDDLHEEAAQRFFDMLVKNKGLYIKQGQAIANQGSVFPVAFQKRFLELYDSAPTDLWQLIDKILRKQYGKNYEHEIFDYFEHNPVASALIAQVHRARLKKEQQEVAVKVQHPYIQRQVPTDLMVYQGMSWVYAQIFDLPLSFFTKYVSEQLEKETDFVMECANGKMLAQAIASDPEMAGLNVYVPRNFELYSGKQVLVTEWIDGVSLTDRKKLEDAKLSLSRVMTQYITVFGRQIFDYGFVHSDPHPGNLLARHFNGSQQLVILDHGLYITLPEKFQSEYCRMWLSMMGMDSGDMSEIAHEWGVDSPELLSTLVLLKPPPATSDQISPYERMRTFFGDESRFPLQLLFILRTMRMMQNLNKTMGSPVNRLNLLTHCDVLVLSRHAWRSRNLRDWMHLVVMRVTLFFSDIVFWTFRLRQVLSGRENIGMEDYIERYMRDAAKSAGFEIVEGM